MFWKKEDKSSEIVLLEESVERRFQIMLDRMNRIENKFDLKVFHLRPICKNWKELFDQMKHIKKTLKKYDPGEVSEIVIKPNFIKVETYHEKEEKVIQTKKKKKPKKRIIKTKKSSGRKTK